MRLKRYWSTTDTKCFQRRILRWYDKNKRIFPWRTNPTPYRVWVSEIMLQQTQAKTVIPYFNRFIRQFPSLESLARASDSKVLEFWAGLGYYNRARNLRKAARQIVDMYGSFPREFETLVTLPGIGRYTAGAICSLAFDQKQPVVDGNVRRLLIRLNAVKKHVADSHHWNQMSALLPEKRISSFNQAMMELGALVCVPFQPRCHQCPVTDFCKARKLGIQDKIPGIQSRQAPQHMNIATLVLKQSGRILLTSRGNLHFIPGEWGLPCEAVPKRESAAKTASLLCGEIIGRTIPLLPIIPIRHSITHHRICAYGFYGEIEGPTRSLRLAAGLRWVSCSSHQKLLTSSLFRKVFKAYAKLNEGEI